MALFLGALERAGDPRWTCSISCVPTRSERPGCRDRAGRPPLRVADWLVEHRLSVAARKLLRAVRDIRRGVGPSPRGVRRARYEAAARARVLRGCRLLSSGRVVITDRLHAHILSLLLGIPHAVLDNTYGKLGRFLDVWTGRRAVVHRATSINDAEDWAACDGRWGEARRASEEAP